MVINPGGSGGAAFTQGTAAAKPAASPNALYYATDTGEWWIANAAGNAWQSIKATSATTFTGGLGGAAVFANQAGSDINFTGATAFLQSCDLDVQTAGKGLKVAEGANARQGLTAAMVAGTVTVANTSVTANSRIQVTRAPGGTNPGAVYVSAITAGTSFVVTSTNAADTGTVFFSIFEPG